jgi:prepilin-type N-terminal cleavage/methylation domain-containing protein
MDPNTKDTPKPAFTKKARSAFTLVELLVTIVIISFGCLAMMVMHSSSIGASSFSDNMTAAVFLAETELERLKALSFPDLEGEIDVGDVTVEHLNRMGEVCPLPPAQCHAYPFTREVRFFRDTPTSFSHQVEVEVLWNDLHGSHSVVFSGVMTSYIFS